jgi:hypothetical protein
MPGLDLRPAATADGGDAHGVLEAAKRKLNSEADAAVVRAVLHPEVTSAPVEAERARADLAGKVAEVYGGVLDRYGQELQVAREASNGAYENGKEDAQRIAAIETTALERAYQSQLTLRDTIAEERRAAAEQHQSDMAALRAELQAMRDQFHQAEVSRLQGEIDALKAKVGGPGAMPAGAKLVTLPDGSQAVQLPPSGGGTAGLLAQLRELAKVQAELRELLGVSEQRPQAVDVNDPSVRHKHLQLDWLDEDKRAAREDRRRLTDAQVKREEAVAKAWSQLPGVAREVVQRARPWVPRILGGAPERGTHNGVAENPPDEVA